MDNNKYVNPYNKEFLKDPVQINDVEYIVSSWTPSRADTTVDTQDTTGAHAGSFYIKGKRSASMTIALVANTDAVPAEYSIFEYDGHKWQIVGEPAKSAASGSQTTYSFTCDEYLLEA